MLKNIHSVLPRLAETYFYRTGAEIDLVIKMPDAEVWAIEIKYGIAPKLGKHFNQTWENVGATQKYVVYGSDDEFPIGNDVQMISLQKLLLALQS